MEQRNGTADSPLRLTYLEGNSWLWEVKGTRILVDPVLVGNLDFGVPWLYDGAKKYLKNFQLSDLKEIDCLLITQSLDDHCHVKTIRPLSELFPNIRVISTPNAEPILYSFFNQILYKLRGSHIHCVYEKDILKGKQADVVITPVIKQLLPAFTLVSGHEDALELTRLLNARFVVPLNNVDLESKGALSSLLRPQGTVESFKLYICFWESTETEAENAEKVVEWLAEGLSEYLPAQVYADLTNVVVAGHSRGGKAAFQVMLNRQAEAEKALAGTTSSSSSPEKLVKIVGVIGLGPVDTRDGPFAKAREKHSLNLGAPAAAIGMQLGEEGGIWACAPKGRNYAQFYSASGPPVYQMLVLHYGHMDVLDDKLPDIKGRLAASVCKSGPSRGPPRRFAGGCVVAFVLDRERAFASLVAHPSSFSPPVNVGIHQSFVGGVVKEEKEKVSVNASVSR